MLITSTVFPSLFLLDHEGLYQGYGKGIDEEIEAELQKLL